ncbi:putative nuclease HARBI1 [Schistocerca piceifrons]|uniref:putative nuclease HARBI1 n=1 Tax=Schistocerca piceifrons TaxID=274613 RepID=UPI001F5E495E|nr:putative nuclease HARBI1 [Schistocerca piceifrons]
MLYLQHINLCNRVGVLVERGNTLEDYGDWKFEERFHLSKETVWWLFDQIHDRLQFPTYRNNTVSPMNRLLMTLRAYATGAFNIAIGDSANVHSTMAQRIISEVSGIIATMSRQYIKFPSRVEVRSVMDGFTTPTRFPIVIGTVDCSHIRIHTIFHNCARRAQFEDGEIPVGHLLGDSSYSCRPHLLIALSNPQSVAEHRYNRSHITTRNTVVR